MSIFENKKKKIFILVGHPDRDSFNCTLADEYQRGAEESMHEVRRVNIEEMQFDPVLHHGYRLKQELEPDLVTFQNDVRWADHFVIFYPSWWSTMPALLKGMFDRMWLPGFAFRFHAKGVFKDLMWRKLLKGKSARVFVLSDSPPVLARIVFGDTTNEIRRGILWFAGFRVRVRKIGPVKFITDTKVDR